MTLLEFIARICAAAAWPVTVLIIVILLRRQIAKIMERLSRLRYKDLDIDFARELEHLRSTALEANVPAQLRAPSTNDPIMRPLELADRLAQDFPEASVSFAWAALETALYDALGRVSGNEQLRFDPYNAVAIARHLRDTGRLDPKTVELLTEMRNLRNHAVHHPGHASLGMTSTEATEYVAHARGLISRLAELKR